MVFDSVAYRIKKLMDIALSLLKAKLSSEHANITQNRKEYKIFYLALKLIHPEPLTLIRIRPTITKKNKLNRLILELPNLITLFS